MRNEGGGSAAIVLAALGIVVVVWAWPFYALCVGLALLALLASAALYCWLAAQRSARRYAAQRAQDRARRVRESRRYAAQERAWSSAAPAHRDVPPPRWRTEQMN